ncbi:MAG: Stp1/IreP family PP2C-type Ser/Thr phosphatase [Actinomycetota bacterium]|nr:Stp1/IreP family PP2C-type Ser/Thr phosphatase [Actinomycetota bacterium]
MTPIGQYAAKTDPGKKRRRNEDEYVIDPPLFGVADGMGGAQAGELAASLAASALREDDGSHGSGEERVAELIQEANRRIYQRSSQDAAVSGMGTTITVALVEDGIVAFGHVGDSRAYLLREGSLEQLTDDHSLVAELVRSGRLSPEEAETHPQRSVITRALGTDPDVDPDTFSIEARPGDVFMICSDGLTSMVDEDRLLAEFEQHSGDLNATAKALVNAANRGGGEDNITVVLFEIAEAGSEPLEETAQYSSPEAAGGEAADEDTLDELDRVPAVDTMVVSGEEAKKFAQAVQDPTPPASPSGSGAQKSRVLPMLLILLVVIAAAALLVWWLAR